MPARTIGDALPRLVDRVVASYLADPRTQHIDKEHLPSLSAIVAVCDQLLEVTYPGYFGRKGLTRHNIPYHVGDLLPRLWENLCSQIESSLACEQEERGASGEGDERKVERASLPASRPNKAGRDAGSTGAHDASSTGAPALADGATAHCRDRAIDLANRFVERIPAIRELLALDVQAAYEGDPAATGTHEIILAYPGILAVTVYRYAHELLTLGVPLMPRMMGEHAHRLTGIDIHPAARIGRSFFIDHGTGVVIGETTIIGENVKIYQGVTLGALSFPKDARGRLIRGTKRHPTVGNGVTIYANATVLGGETTLGDGSIVGGSVFVATSVEPGHMVSITPPVLKVRAPQVQSKIIDGQLEPSWDI